MCLHALHGVSQHVSQDVIRSVRQLPLRAISSFLLGLLAIMTSIYSHASMAAVVVHDHTELVTWLLYTAEQPQTIVCVEQLWNHFKLQPTTVS